MKNSVFWNVAPCRSCLNRCFGGTYRLHLQGKKILKRRTSSLQTPTHSGSLLEYFSTLKMEAICSSETSVDFENIARRYNPGDITSYFKDV
jgi:hypothetical protein